MGEVGQVWHLYDYTSVPRDYRDFSAFVDPMEIVSLLGHKDSSLNHWNNGAQWIQAYIWKFA